MLKFHQCIKKLKHYFYTKLKINKSERYVCFNQLFYVGRQVKVLFLLILSLSHILYLFEMQQFWCWEVSKQKHQLNSHAI